VNGKNIIPVKSKRNTVLNEKINNNIVSLRYLKAVIPHPQIIQK
jgi:hypothetical protein